MSENTGENNQQESFGNINLKFIGSISITVLMALAFYFGGLESRVRAAEVNTQQIEEMNAKILELTISINQLKYEIQVRNKSHAGE